MNNADNGKNIGQGMVFIAWLLFLSLLAFGFSKYLERQNNPNQNISAQWNDDIAEVKLTQNRYGHYVVTGQINHIPVTFLLDTGATYITIPASIANQLQLKKGYTSQSRTANGNITVFDCQLDSVSIGAIELHNIRAKINPHQSGNEVLLGMSFMKHLEIIQKGNEMTLRY